MHLATIRAVARTLTRRGVPPAVAEDAACEAWTRAWARGGEGSRGLRRWPLCMAARRLATVGRGGASRGVAGLELCEDEAAGGDTRAALDDVIDAATLAGASTVHAIEALRRAGWSVADIAASVGASDEAVRLWARGAVPRPAARRRIVDAVAALAS